MSAADTRYYLDTSALLPYYRNELASAAVEGFLSSLTVAVSISLLTEMELASALARIVRMGGLAEAEAARIDEQFEYDCSAGLFKRTPIAATHYRQAKAWLAFRDSTLRTLDALHLACSHAIGAELVTADRALHEAAIRMKVRSKLVTDT